MAQHHTLGELYDALQQLHCATWELDAANQEQDNLDVRVNSDVEYRDASAKVLRLTSQVQELRAQQVNVYHPCTDVG